MQRLIMPLMGDGDDHDPPAQYALVELDQRATELYMAIIEWFASQIESVAPLRPWTMSFEVPCPRCFDRHPELIEPETGGILEIDQDDAFDLAGYPDWQPQDDDRPEVRSDAHVRFDTESVSWLVFGEYGGMTMPLTWHQLAVWAGKLRRPEAGAMNWNEFVKRNPIPRRSAIGCAARAHP